LDRHFRLLEAKSARTAEQRRRREEEKRTKAQKKRALEQQEKASERVHEARERGETVTGVDTLERKKIAKELTWKGKWDTRRAKFNVRARKYR